MEGIFFSLLKFVSLNFLALFGYRFKTKLFSLCAGKQKASNRALPFWCELIVPF